MNLYKALQLIGFTKSNEPRKLERRGFWVKLEFKSDITYWHVGFNLESKRYEGEKRALHALVLYGALSKEDLAILIQLGYDKAKEELANYDKTKKRAEKLETKILKEFEKRLH
ncbi:MAG: hypothetical protein ACP5HJ_02595 [Candidatus Micrarchaeia archaeon]